MHTIAIDVITVDLQTKKCFVPSFSQNGAGLQKIKKNPEEKKTCN